MLQLHWVIIFIMPLHWAWSIYEGGGLLGIPNYKSERHECICLLLLNSIMCQIHNWTLHPSEISKWHGMTGLLQDAWVQGCSSKLIHLTQVLIEIRAYAYVTVLCECFKRKGLKNTFIIWCYDIPEYSTYFHTLRMSGPAGVVEGYGFRKCLKQCYGSYALHSALGDPLPMKVAYIIKWGASYGSRVIGPK